MSTIKIQCADQCLSLVETPDIYSGDVNYDQVEFDFCENWTGFAKTAVFYNTKENIYEQILDAEDKCNIPQEVMVNAGDVYLGVFGVNGTTVITSQVLCYKVREGVPTSDLVQPDPNPDVLEQILASYNATKTALETEYATITTNLETEYNTITTNLETDYNTITTDLETDYTTTTTALEADYNTFKSDLTNTLSSLIAVEEITQEVTFYAGSPYGACMLSIEKENYTPIGMVGFIVESNLAPTACTGIEINSSSSGYKLFFHHYVTRTLSSNVTTNLTVKILYIKTVIA